ncbi:MAG: VOC family protein [Gemmatimonadales bacterium]
MPVIRRVLETVLYCDDLAHTARFYRRLLGGADPLVDSDRMVALDAGSATVLLLFQRGATTTPLVTPGGTIPPHDGVDTGHVAFAVDEASLPEWEAVLRELDVVVESVVTWERGGRSLYFRDPDGRSVELATPGTWPTY